MCVDVYSDILPMNDMFLQKRKIIREIVKSTPRYIRDKGSVGRRATPSEGDEKDESRPRRVRFRRSRAGRSAGDPADSSPYYEATGMNVSYVLSSVLSSTGLRPFDYLSFHHNSKSQALNVISSCETFETKSFNGSHYFDTCASAPLPPDPRNLGSRFFQCLSSSMIVPGASGPPVLVDSDRCFDAFVYEAIPLRTPVEHGSTHVVCLRTRPQGAGIKTVRGIYEKAVAPKYFDDEGKTERHPFLSPSLFP